MFGSKFSATSLYFFSFIILLLPIAAPPALAAPGGTIEQFDDSWSHDPVGLAYDAFRDRMVYFHQDSSSSLWLAEISAPHTTTAMSVIKFERSGKDFTGGTVVPSNGNIYASDYNGDLSRIDDHIMSYDTNGNLLAYWELDDEVRSGAGCAGNVIDLAYWFVCMFVI